MRLCRCVFINHIDREHANFDVAMGNRPSCSFWFTFRCRVHIPIGVDKDFKGVIDILRMKARYFEGDDERIEEIPEEYLDAAHIAREKLCDLVAEADDELMMKYLDGEEQLTQEELESLLDKAIAQEIFTLCLWVQLSSNRELKVLGRLASYFPHPRAHGPFYLANGDELFVDETGEPAGFVFKTLADLMSDV